MSDEASRASWSNPILILLALRLVFLEHGRVGVKEERLVAEIELGHLCSQVGEDTSRILLASRQTLKPIHGSIRLLEQCIIEWWISHCGVRQRRP